MTATKKSTQKPAAAKATDSVEAAVAAGKETVETVVKAGTDAATKGIEKAVAAGQEHVAAAAKAGTEVFKSYEDVIGFGKQNFDAVITANALFVKGVQDINAELFKLAQASLEDNAQATKKILASKSVEDAFAIQSEIVKTNYDKAVKESRKITDLSVKVTEAAVAPITKQVSETVEKLTKLAA